MHPGSPEHFAARRTLRRKLTLHQLTFAAFTGFVLSLMLPETSLALSGFLLGASALGVVLFGARQRDLEIVLDVSPVETLPIWVAPLMAGATVTLVGAHELLLELSGRSYPVDPSVSWFKRTGFALGRLLMLCAVIRLVAHGLSARPWARVACLSGVALLGVSAMAAVLDGSVRGVGGVYLHLPPSTVTAWFGVPINGHVWTTIPALAYRTGLVLTVVGLMPWLASLGRRSNAILDDAMTSAGAFAAARPTGPSSCSTTVLE